MSNGKWCKVLCAGYYQNGGLDFAGRPVRLPGSPIDFDEGLINSEQAPYSAIPQEGEQVVVEMEINFNQCQFRLLRWGYRYCFIASGGVDSELINFLPFVPSSFQPIAN